MNGWCLYSYLFGIRPCQPTLPILDGLNLSITSRRFGVRIFGFSSVAVYSKLFNRPSNVFPIHFFATLQTPVKMGILLITYIFDKGRVPSQQYLIIPSLTVLNFRNVQILCGCCETFEFARESCSVLFLPVMHVWRLRGYPVAFYFALLLTMR